ncbi:uncharacterized protein LOC127797323 isoform X1 [Diospyros lotus]|uniref:uncharacterized protein LOC127797323 isoform X1 n=1 Tax=Diospyros lotus TaxID=55363 RepID=UPI0022512A5D|nr:uncharacterized protein LOC127797323 isoform X1 [Diospyros lotus]
MICAVISGHSPVTHGFCILPCSKSAISFSFLSCLAVRPYLFYGDNNSRFVLLIDEQFRHRRGSSLYFLHHSNSLGLVLVSQSLTGDNCALWSPAMLIALSVKNKLGFIDGSIGRLTIGDPLFSAWIRNNHIVISWILNSVSKEILASVIYSEFAHEIWTDLKERYQQRNGPRIFQLQRDLMNLSQVLADHYQTEYVMSFLMGLNDTFVQVRDQLLLMDPIPPINKTLTPVQYQQLMGMLSSHLSDAKSNIDVHAFLDQASGTCFSISVNPGLSYPRYWIIDSGATNHICCNWSSFQYMRPVQNSFVTLPNHSHISVNFIGTVRINAHLVLENVLYMPHFKFNLISVSALTGKNILSLNFF